MLIFSYSNYIGGLVMLSSSDFRYIYNYCLLPEGKSLLSAEEIQNNAGGTDKISREWIRIEIRIYSLAKSLLEKNFPREGPAEFHLWIEHRENLRRLTSEYHFRVKRVGTHEYDFNCLVYFL